MTWTPANIVAAWEAASGLSPPRRTARLLVWSGGAVDEASALELDVATTASLLWASYADAFGPTADMVVACGSCGAALEAEIQLPHGAAVRTPHATAARVAGFEVRVPTLGELDRVHGRPDAGAQLRAWCVVPIDGRQPSPSAPHVGDAGCAEMDWADVDAAVDELAGTAALHAHVVCPECDAGFEATLDPGALVWDRIRLEAPRLLAEVTVLAQAFGWSESEILGLSDARRDAYLNLVGAP